MVLKQVMNEFVDNRDKLRNRILKPMERHLKHLTDGFLQSPFDSKAELLFESSHQDYLKCLTVLSMVAKLFSERSPLKIKMATFEN